MIEFDSNEMKVIKHNIPCSTLLTYILWIQKNTKENILIILISSSSLSWLAFPTVQRIIFNK